MKRPSRSAPMPPKATTIIRTKRFLSLLLEGNLAFALWLAGGACLFPHSVGSMYSPWRAGGRKPPVVEIKPVFATSTGGLRPPLTGLIYQQSTGGLRPDGGLAQPPAVLKPYRKMKWQSKTK